MTFVRRALTATGLVAGLLSLAACSSATAPPSGSSPASPAVSAKPVAPASPEQASPSGLTHVKMALTSKSTGGLYLFVGKDLGIYQKYGIDPEIVIGDSGILVTGLASGDIDFLGTTPTAIQGAEKGLPIRVIDTAKNHPEYLLIGDTGITQVSQLKGKQLAGSNPAQLPAQMTRLLLQVDGLQPSDYTILPVANDSARQAMIQNHQAAAAALGLAQSIPLLNAGHPLLDSTLDKVWFPSNGLGATLKTMQERPDLTKRVVAATLEATSVSANQKDQVVPVMVKEFGFNETDASKVFDLLKPSYTTDGRAADEAIRTQIQLDYESMQLPQAAKPEQIYDNSFLPAGSSVLASASPSGGAATSTVR